MQVKPLKFFFHLQRCLTCIMLTFLLSFSFTISAWLSPKVEDAHAFAFAIPAGAAAAGLTEEAAIAAMGAIMAAGAGVSLSSIVGANSSSIGDWTDEQLGRAGDILDNWLSNHQKWQEQSGQDGYNTAIQKIETSSGGGDGNKPNGGKWPDPNDFDNNSLWYLLCAVNNGYVLSSSLGSFIDSLFDIFMPLEGSLGNLYQQSIIYPNLNYSIEGNTVSIPVVSTAPVFDTGIFVGICNYYSNRPYCFYITNTGNFNPSSVTLVSSSVSDSGYSLVFKSDISIESARFVDATGSNYYSAGFSGNNKSFSITSDSTNFPGDLSAISPSLASLIDSSYSSSTDTVINNNYTYNDTPSQLADAVSTADVDAIKDYLDSIAKSVDSSTGQATYTYINKATDTVPSSYQDSITQTQEQPEKAATPEETPTVTIPSDYNFPDSWNDGSIKWNRVFPFFFLDDLCQIMDKWFPVGEYNPVFEFTIPNFWGGKDSQKIVIDFSLFEPFRPFVYYVFLAGVFIALLARMFTWWGGFTTKSDDD